MKYVPQADLSVMSFQVNNESFDLEDKFDIKLSEDSVFKCVLQEDKIIEALYQGPLFYGEVGREFCIIFDIFYSKAGTEVIAESFYRVME